LRKRLQTSGYRLQEKLKIKEKANIKIKNFILQK